MRVNDVIETAIFNYSQEELHNLYIILFWFLYKILSFADSENSQCSCKMKALI